MVARPPDRSSVIPGARASQNRSVLEPHREPDLRRGDLRRHDSAAGTVVGAGSAGERDRGVVGLIAVGKLPGLGRSRCLDWLGQASALLRHQNDPGNETPGPRRSDSKPPAMGRWTLRCFRSRDRSMRSSCSSSHRFSSPSTAIRCARLGREPTVGKPPPVSRPSASRGPAPPRGRAGRAPQWGTQSCRPVTRHR
jgi:hypothetical protein